ncbi:amino acid adenylation domain-containing protein [Streptomyces sp. NBC_00083]|uniref:non-ribosomal peptide synthetase n=1 Tax=Streptomyces sp. NBC_00083 TaxID=2975647 RepID=UPI0022538234|nr:amino acid adenylation domain-containing protein [Streptomyces sp. NBC_00083]MCX5385400.1 amino acid adenylation domain-containing protein [Streptomyces sp. NBC_00083]
MTEAGATEAEATAFWQEVLSAGRHTPLPGWCADVPAEDRIATRRTLLSPTTSAALLGPATGGAEPLETLLIAAAARVLATVTGDPTVVTGYLPPGATDPVAHTLPCPLHLGDGTWRELVGTAAAVRSAAERHRSVSPERVRAELGRTDALFDTIVVAGRPPEAADLGPGTVLALGLLPRGGRLELAVLHRVATLDASAAGRIAGYLLAALERLATRPDSAQHLWHPVTAGEAAHLRDALAGPRRPLPDRRFHELFEEQARLTPDAVAAVHEDRSWTYGELNRNANRVAHALRRDGLRDEDVVAVVTERDLEWLTAVLAVFKAGGVYLPVEPQFPVDRITAMLTRSDCRRVLTEPGVSPGLDEALAELTEVRAEFVSRLRADESHAGSDADPALAIAAGRLAYIYFTSGSTGQPKGAMCEHEGFLNHLLAKIEDLGVERGTVVAQTAPQCFDISLWQLVAALAVGGRTLIVAQRDILEVPRFVALLAEREVEVAQLVPSYLEVVLDHLRRSPRPLPRLRCVSATGEALKKELTERWFAALPDIVLVNAYGLTETSDDTNHEVLRRPPAGASVPLGRPVRNVRVAVLDERLRPVPLGSPGELVFSGVCVGRGYVNDEERTRAAYLPDPDRPGGRLYRSGDFGRWQPDGRLEFLGRRDAQIKIRGFRIEIGEVENQLLRFEGVRDAAVVVVGTGDARRLAAFYASAEPVPADALRTALARSLPAYMLPGRFHHHEELPLTPNGKIDRKLLTQRAEAAPEQADGGPAGATEPPRTPTEHRLAALWATTLKVPVETIGRATDFYEAGGSSIALLRVVIALDQVVTAPELARAPVLSAAALLIDGKAPQPA